MSWLVVPPFVLDVVGRLEAVGGAVWVVGGAVRDAWRGERTADWDLATDLLPDRVATALGVAPGRDARFGAVHLEAQGLEVTVQTLREEAGYRDRRHPDEVRFVGEPERDARRRDFTINAVYADARTARVVDPTGGLEDLDRRMLRVIGEPAARLAEDALRVLRAVRFAARCDLCIEPATAAALRQTAPLVAELAPERVLAELTAAFTGAGRGRALRLLVELGVADVILPEVAAMRDVPQPPQFHPEGDVLPHVAMVLDRVPADDPILAWAAVLHDVGKPPTFERAADRIRFSGHDVVSARMATDVLRRLRAPRAWIEAVEELCRDHIRFAALPLMGKAKRERWMRSPRFGAHLEFHRADCEASHGKLDVYWQAREQWRTLPPEPPPPLCTGADVLALGVPQGPLVGELLAELERRLEGVDRPDRGLALSILATVVAESIKGA